MAVNWSGGTERLSAAARWTYIVATSAGTLGFLIYSALRAISLAKREGLSLGTPLDFALQGGAAVMAWAAIWSALYFALKYAFRGLRWIAAGFVHQ